MQRERFKSRLGFLLLSAGCAIGLGNVWRFPYMVGQNGGAFFVLFYLAFLILVDDPMQAVWFVVLFLCLQQVEGNLIYPRVVGNSVGLPSIWVLAAVTVGGSLMGIVGMLVMIPLASVCYSLLRASTHARLRGRGIDYRTLRPGGTPGPRPQSPDDPAKG